MKASDAQAKRALLDAANSNVARLEKLQAYEKIYAPFDGTITARNVDAGALIEAGSAGGPARELFDLAQTGTMRVYVDVPQDDSRQATAADAQAYLSLSQFPDRKFPGQIARNAGSRPPRTSCRAIRRLSTCEKVGPEKRIMSTSTRSQVRLSSSERIKASGSR